MKWFIPLVALTAATLLLLAAHSSLAERGTAALSGVNCSYGDRHFNGANQLEARKKAADYCMDSHLGQFHALSRGVPEGEQADMLIEDCVNNTFCK